MIQIEDKIVSADLLRIKFCCDLAACRGICCVEGNAGAPLEADEPGILERELPAYREFLKPEGLAAIEAQGFGVIDSDGDLTTPLINEAECAFSFEENGITFCAVERAYKARKTAFPKPISCHLYPIRLSTFTNGTTALNYHRWKVCTGALTRGEMMGIPLYRALREPIIRRFGQPFFDELEQAGRLLREQEG